MQCFESFSKFEFGPILMLRRIRCGRVSSKYWRPGSCPTLFLSQISVRKTFLADLGRFFIDSRPPQKVPMLHFTFSLDRCLKRQSDAGIFPPASAENSGPHMLT